MAIQKNSKTIEERIILAINKLVKEEIEFFGASRTDKGVHALGQVASFKTNCSIPIENIPKVLNGMLPDDIVIKSAEEMSEDFNARFSSVGKKYIYKVVNDNNPSAILRNHVYYYNKKLDYNNMQEACKCFIGTHDFETFRNTGGAAKTTIRTINQCELIKNGDLIELHISGDGFLYNMIRIIMGTIIEVGIGNIRAEQIDEIIQSKNRKKAGKTAPAHGLYLSEVLY